MACKVPAQCPGEWDGGGGVFRGRMQRGKIGSLGHYDPIFIYLDIL